MSPVAKLRLRSSQEEALAALGRCVHDLEPHADSGEGIRDTITIVRALRQSLMTAKTPGNIAAFAERQKLRGQWAKQADKRLSFRTGPLITHHFSGVVTETNHAESIAQQLDAHPDRDGKVEYVFLLLEHGGSKLSEHVRNRWARAGAKATDAKDLARRIDHDVDFGKTIDGEHFVELALRAVKWPKPERLFAPRNPKAHSKK
jgi:hypothetical protein